jgi:capsular exopolysaccharide synthesis family protein
MGRIAEALRRAQQERAQRLDPSTAAPFDVGPMPVSLRAGPRSATAESFRDLAQSVLLNPPPPPRPFPIRAPSIINEAISPHVVILHQPDSAMAEKYRSIRTRLITANPSGSPRAFAVSSALRKEGKSTTTANLGFSLSELQYLRVAMIDLDFRQRGLSELLGAGDCPGIADVLRGEKTLADVCMPVVRDNLYFIPAGDPAGAAPGELLASKLVGTAFKELTERFHYSLIDTPPVSTAADIGLIAPLCHSVIMVIRMHRTPEPLLCRCVKMLQANHVSIAGCILAGYTETTLSVETHDYYQTVA